MTTGGKTMPTELAKAFGKYRDAEDDYARANAAECLEEALQHFAEQVRRETILRCTALARLRGHGDTADDLTALLEA